MSSYIGNVVKMAQVLEFEVVFPNEEPKTIEQYLSGGSKEIILNVAAFFLGFKSFDSKYKSNVELLKAIFNPENNSFANAVYNKIIQQERIGREIIIINTYSSLRLFEYFFSKEEEVVTQTATEFERNLFKAYLVLNSQYTAAQKLAFESTKNLLEEIKVPMLFFSMHYPISDKTNYDINQVWISQVAKAIYLFQFLENHTKTRDLLNAFLTHFEKKTWQDYLKDLIPLTDPAIKKVREAHTDIVINPGAKHKESCDFLEKLVVKDNDPLYEYDFLTLRERPFYKISDGVYRIIFNLFVVEKIYKGLYFLLRDINAKLPSKIKEIRSFYGDEFSEKFLSYKVIESIYRQKCLKLSGKEISDLKIDGGPDYYIRKGKDILIFESKDFLVKADDKLSFNFEVYEKEFRRILYFEILPDGREKPKAVMQLINFLRELLQNNFKPDTNYKYKEVYIYPILLTHDSQYDTFGFNELLDFWFQDELLGLKDEGLFIHRVKPITVINIDCLIDNQAALAESEQLHEIIKLYHEHKMIDKNKKFKTKAEHEQYMMTKLIPFAQFIDRYFNKKGLNKLPPILDEVREALFPEEYHAEKGKSFK